MNSFDARSQLNVGDRSYEIFRLDALQSKFDVARLPFALKVLLENLLRYEDGQVVSADDVEALARWVPTDEPSREIAYTPARVLMQDFTGVPAVVDLAAMRDAMGDLGGDPARINPLQPAELVIDHSVQVDAFGTARAFQINADREFERNMERYAFLKWGQQAFDNFSVVPPDTGIVHQVNLEYLARVVFTSDGDGITQAYPDTLVGTDSHTTMVNGRDRGRGGDARPAGLDADPAGDRLQAQRRAAGGRDGDGPGLDGHPDAAPEGRRGQIRRVLRRRPRGPAACGPRHDLEHVARAGSDVRHVAGGC
jgi:aconitase A